MQDHEFQSRDDEIELIDILRVLWRWKVLIVFGTLLLAVLAGVVSMMLPEVYEVNTLLEPGTRPITNEKGQIVEERPVETPKALKEAILGGAYDEAIREKLDISYEEYPDVQVQVPKETSLIKISIESSKPERASAILKEMVALISADIREKLDTEKIQIQNEIKLAKIQDRKVGEKIKLAEQQIAETKAKILDLEKDREKSLAARSSDAMSVLLYSNEIQNQQVYLNNLQEKLKNLEADAEGADIRIENLRLKLDQIESTNIYKPPYVPEKPTKPKKVLIVALAFMLGLMGTTVLAFLLEYVKRTRESERQTKKEGQQP